jgi:hypothetical protein
VAAASSPAIQLHEVLYLIFDDRGGQSGSQPRLQKNPEVNYQFLISADDGGIVIALIEKASLRCRQPCLARMSEIAANRKIKVPAKNLPPDAEIEEPAPKNPIQLKNANAAHSSALNIERW